MQGPQSHHHLSVLPLFRVASTLMNAMCHMAAHLSRRVRLLPPHPPFIFLGNVAVSCIRLQLTRAVLMHKPRID